MKYVTYDYEEPGPPNNYWHIYTLGNEPDSLFDNPSVFTMTAPCNEKTEAAIARICEAIDAAIDAAQL